MLNLPSKVYFRRCKAVAKQPILICHQASYIRDRRVCYRYEPLQYFHFSNGQTAPIFVTLPFTI